MRPAHLQPVALPAFISLRASCPWLWAQGELQRQLRHHTGSHDSIPQYDTGQGTFDSDLVFFSQGRAIGKKGAEGIYCLAIPEKRLGVCIKMLDGHPWSGYPVAVRILQELDIIDDWVVKKLEKWALPEVKDDKGNVVGYLHPVFSIVNNETGSFEPGDTFPKEREKI